MNISREQDMERWKETNPLTQKTVNCYLACAQEIAREWTHTKHTTGISEIIEKHFSKFIYAETIGTKISDAPCSENTRTAGIPVSMPNPPTATDEDLEEIVEGIFQVIGASEFTRPLCREAILDYTEQLRREIVELAELNRNAVAGNERLKQQLAEAKKDSDRLDWAILRPNSFLKAAYRGTEPNEFEGGRETIDAAMNKEK